ncbi:hypothetical protein [Micromonospora aurantiaca (nom. illeg.)]|uniref:hypothetical protein n=1 Tax=Micromonospora aurantiaca (nom. illeg.) TaxID=47850 RepID=UPI000F3BE4CF|nr:hypothetical protein [Micromonospora aurantiaca]RNH98589.1 hypothetical protein EEZ25_26165 [Micromonospora aurantiaca]
MLDLIPRSVARAALRMAILRHWPRYGDVRITDDLVPPDRMATIIPMASSRRFQNAIALLRIYLCHSVQPYLPVRLPGSRDAGPGAVLLSPLVEVNGSELILLDGVHRCLAARYERIPALAVTLIRPAFTPLPAGPRLSLGEVLHSKPDEEPPIFFEGRHLADFRPGRLFVESAVDLINQA